MVSEHLIHAHYTVGMAKLDGGTSDAMLASLPLGRMQHPWDIAIAAVYLASPAARCLSGDTLVWPLMPSLAGLCKRKHIDGGSSG